MSQVKPQIKTHIRKIPDGFYLSVGQEIHHGDYVDSQCDIDSHIVGDITQARVWFKTKIAEFYHTSENDLSPLWWWTLPKILWY